MPEKHIRAGFLTKKHSAAGRADTAVAPLADELENLRPMTNPPTTLFLHGGPGFTAELERQQFADSLPVYWWDQPHAQQTSGAYETLVNAARAELHRLYRESGEPIGLLANSFGVHLALELMERAPHEIARVTIVGGVVDTRSAFVRLGRHLAATNGDEALAAAALDAEQGEGNARLWRLIERLLGVTDLLNAYWSPNAGASQAAMTALAREDRLMHSPTFQAVLADFLDRPAARLTRWQGPAEVIIGRYDPFSYCGEEELWRSLLPAPSIRTVETGHFPHLELPSSEWLSGTR
jgi:pimeloyl-ACP methyl ester carboxylesterase